MLKRLRNTLLAVGLLATLPLSLLAEPGSAEDRLRGQLRQTTLDLRSAQEQLASLRAENDSLKAAAALAKPAATPAVDAAAQRALAAKSAELASLRAESSSNREALAKWQSAYQEAAEVARTRDLELRRLSEAGEQAGNYGRDCAAKNRELVDIGQQLLQRYRDKGVFSSLAQAEPLTGLAKVRFETLVQEYAGKLADAAVPPAPAAAATEASAAAPEAAAAPAP